MIGYTAIRAMSKWPRRNARVPHRAAHGTSMRMAAVDPIHAGRIVGTLARYSNIINHIYSICRANFTKKNHDLRVIFTQQRRCDRCCTV